MNSINAIILGLSVVLIFAVFALIKLVGDNYDRSSALEVVSRENLIFRSTIEYSCLEMNYFIETAKNNAWEFEISTPTDNSPMPLELRNEDIASVLILWVNGRLRNKFEEVHLYFDNSGCLVGD